MADSLLLLMDSERLKGLFDEHAGSDHLLSREAFDSLVGERPLKLSWARSTEERQKIFDRNDHMSQKALTKDAFVEAIQRTKSELVQFLTSMPILEALAQALFQQVGDDQDFGGSIPHLLLELGQEGLQKAVEQTSQSIVHILLQSCSKLQRFKEKQDAEKSKNEEPDSESEAEQQKYCFHIDGGNLQDFNKGLSNLVGIPDPNVWEGMRREHVEAPTADQVFVTPNYGIRTTSKIEYNLALSGGTYYQEIFQGQRKAEGPLSEEEQSLVEEGGKPRKGRDSSPDRVLWTMEEYEKMDVVQTANLSKSEILAIVLYTGPMYKAWNTTLRSGEGHYRTSIHVLSSAAKKIQQCNYQLRPGMLLYRGLSGGKLPDRIFGMTKEGESKTSEVGMTEFGVQSTTSNMEIALQYSGVSSGFVATVIEMKVGQVDSGAFISELSQYPFEKEYVWAPGCYMQSDGDGRMELTEEGQMVRVVPMRINANGRTRTVEEVMDERRMNLLNSYELVKREIESDLRILELASSPNHHKLIPHLENRNIFTRVRQDTFVYMEDFEYMDGAEETPQPSFVNTGVPQFITKLLLPKWLKQKIESQKDVMWFNNDKNYKTVLNETVDLRRYAQSVVLHFAETMSDEDWWSMLRESYDYSDCRISFMHQQRVAALRNKLLNLRDKVAKAPDENRKFMAGQEVRKVVLELIESEGYDSLEAFVDEEMKTTPLMHEASRGNVELMKLMIEVWVADFETFRIKARDAKGLTALHYAASMGQLEALQYLVHSQTPKLLDINDQDKDGDTPIFHAIRNGHVEVTKYLMQIPGIRTAASDGFTVLMCACRFGQMPIVRYLLTRPDVNVNEATSDGRTAFFRAASWRHVDIMRLLVENGCEVGQKDDMNQTVLRKACNDGHVDVVAYLTSLSSCDVNEQDELGTTPLMGACLYGHDGVVETLLKHPKIKVGLKNEDGDNAFAHLFRYDETRAEARLQITKLLSSHTPTGQLNETNAMGRTVVMDAASFGDVESLKILLERSDCDLHFAGHDCGMEPVVDAAMRGHVNVVSMMSERPDFDLHKKYDNGNSLLFYAESIDLMKFLVAQGLDPHATNDRGETLLMLKTSSDDINLFKYLVEDLECDTNAVDNEGMSVFLWAASSGKEEVVKYMIEECSADILSKSTTGDTCLILASQAYEGCATIEFLLQQESAIDMINHQNDDGSTALMSAAEGGELEVVQALLRNSLCDRTLHNSSGKTAKMIAEEEGHDDIVAIL